MSSKEFRDEQLQLLLWGEMVETLFDGDVPLYKEWNRPDEIIEVLDFIGKNKASNHTFPPKNGGFDLKGCTFSNELGLVELKSGSINNVMKSGRLIFQWFPKTGYEWAYFMLETSKITPSGVYESSLGKKEVLVEINPGQYIDRKYLDIEEYCGQPLPKDARTIYRFMSGKFVIFSKVSKYMTLQGVYSGKHDEVSSDVFKIQIENEIRKNQKE
ncbi:hypothetical protein [Bacillus ndiopicus]|uniref:hypothetical protein n=1 Tax=Bacillus ndiopicus TaxID=1347368 RepID=UPI0006938EAB|nr:hypothetical protein [Bacillus ndiopicus]